MNGREPTPGEMQTINGLALALHDQVTKLMTILLEVVPNCPMASMAVASEVKVGGIEDIITLLHATSNNLADAINVFAGEIRPKIGV